MSDIRARDLVRADEGLISRRIFFDPEIYRAELENIFAKSWLYLAHESQIPNPGDYTTNYMGEDPVLIWRGMDGKVRAFLNICPHRGAQLCRHREGNAKAFHCLYHGWSFASDGDVLHIAEEETYSAEFKASGRNNLVPVPHFDQYRGFWFLNFDPGAPTLRDSVRAGHPITLDAIETSVGVLAPRQSAALNVDIIARLVDDIVLVSDEEMHSAARWLWREFGIGAELAGAAAVAALREGRIPSRTDEVICAVVCGAGTDGMVDSGDKAG